MDGQLLGEGMEGAVYALDDHRVAKVWHHGSIPALQRLTHFYAGLSFTFAVPRIDEITTVDGRVVTIEKRLHGTPGRATTDVIVALATELAATGPHPEARTLPVLGGNDPLLTRDEDFPVGLARLAAARATPVLRHAVDDADRKIAALKPRLAEVDTGRRTVIHGDLFPGNVLVDDEGRPTAVLDWGFLTTEGDPAFEAAVAAAIYDMYGPDAPDTEDELLSRMPYDRTTLLVHRAAYSMLTATAYDPSGRDGHFAWCMAALNRPDVTRALLGP